MVAYLQARLTINMGESLAPDLSRAHAHPHARANPQQRDSKNRMLSPRNRETALLVAILSVFGPYVVKSLNLRTEQLVVYPAFIVMLAASRMPRPHWRLVSTLPLAWIALLPVSILGSIFILSQGPNEFSYVTALGSVDSIMLPAAMAWIGAAVVVQSDDPLRTLRRSAWAIVLLAAANGIVAIASVVTDLTSALSLFWSSGVTEGPSVAIRALGGSRHSGIFNQPFEAGLAYSVTLLLWCFLFFQRDASAFWSAIVLPPLVVGGLLPASKVFMFGGLPLSLAYFAWGSWFHHMRVRPLAIVVSALAAAGATYAALPRNVMPVSRFSHVFETDTVYRLSGGRYSTESETDIESMFGRLSESPLVGFGLDPQIGPFDNALLAQMILGGILGAVLLGWVWWILVVHVFSAFGSASAAAVLLEALIIVLLLGSMLGAHPFLVNRAGSLALLTLGVVRGYLTTSADPYQAGALSHAR